MNGPAMTRVKICGITNVEHARCALEAGADMLGFVFAPSRRRISQADCAEIVARCLEGFPKEQRDWLAVGVFVNQPLLDVVEAADVCGLDAIQLSGDESLDYCRQMPRPLFRVVHMPSLLAVPGPAGAEGRLRELRAESAAARLLLDAGGPGQWGGTGASFDWGLLGEAARDCIAAGGLNPTNVDEAISTMRPWAVDVSTGVESAGRKDPILIQHFIAEVRRSDEHATT